MYSYNRKKCKKSLKNGEIKQCFASNIFQLWKFNCEVNSKNQIHNFLFPLDFTDLRYIRPFFVDFLYNPLQLKKQCDFYNRKITKSAKSRWKWSKVWAQSKKFLIFQKGQRFTHQLEINTPELQILTSSCCLS